MSRTVRNSKPPGYDYWSKRPCSIYFPPGSYTKKLCHKIERQQNKMEIRKLINDTWED